MKTTILLFMIMCTAPQLLAPFDANLDEEIIGYWIIANYGEDNVTYQKVKRFQQDNAGFSFLKNGKLIRRQNAGWCGTPPISYRNYDGEWSINSDGHIELSYEFWGGEMKETWQVNSLKDKALSVTSVAFETIKE